MSGAPLACAPLAASSKARRDIRVYTRMLPLGRAFGATSLAHAGYATVMRGLFDRLRVDRRPGSAGDNERRAAKEEFIDPVLGTVLGELLEVEDFAHAQTHGRNDHPVPGLVCFGGLVRSYLDPP